MVDRKHRIAGEGSGRHPSEREGGDTRADTDKPERKHNPVVRFLRIAGIYGIWFTIAGG
ncbi:hypothetical protein [Microbacterium sp. USTB-Y]|uniref:hypothetical protein n=1 Tax=Microbacterium sp. USTB-Y TaxID=2823692 RepID=UPI00203CCDC2|nr:hypothetical protein [Microbacterium sp. USTB-Y]